MDWEEYDYDDHYPEVWRMLLFYAFVIGVAGLVVLVLIVS